MGIQADVNGATKGVSTKGSTESDSKNEAKIHKIIM